jgi:pancreatic triacylglycerol lipase
MICPAGILILSLFCGLSASSPTPDATISKDVNELKYYYYPSASNQVEIAFNNRNSLDASNIRAGVKTIIIVDGFLSDSTSPMSTLTKQSYISRGDSNVIVVDWGKLSGAGLTLGNLLQTASAYITVLGNVGPAGQRLAEFINFLKVNKNIQFADVTIVGHSLGAHIGGAAGVAVRNNYNSLIGRIVGLDPAGPFFSLQVSKDKRLHKGDAVFVDIYHTNRGTLGDSDHDTADVNVYVNGGKDQPGCEEADSAGFAGYCSHSYSWKFFNAAFGNLKACPCSGDSACVCTTCSYSCSNGINVGPNLSTSARGRYHITLGSLE